MTDTSTASSPVGQDVLGNAGPPATAPGSSPQNPDPNNPPPGWTWTAQGWHLSFGALEALFIQAGGPVDWAATMALVAEAESGGNAWEVNGSGFTGLWQQGVKENGFPDRPSRQQMLDPFQNAVQAKALLGNGSGISNWGAGTGDAVGTAAQAQGNRPLSWTQIQSFAKGMGVDTSSGADSIGASISGDPTATNVLCLQVIPGLPCVTIPGLPGGNANPGGGGSINPLAPLDWASSLGKILAWLGDKRNWLRIGEMVLGAVLVIGGTAIFIASSEPGQKAIQTGESVGEIAALA